MTEPMPAALAGIRVVDLTTDRSAYAGRLLADLGADVVRVEPPGGATLRRLRPLRAVPNGESFAHAFFDAGKRSIVADLAAPEGRRRLDALVARSDVLLHTPRGHGAPVLAPAELRAGNPRLIVVSITPFGSSGPHAGYVAGDLTMLAAGGLLSLGGYADTEPIGIRGGQAQIACGIFAAVAALAALVAREHDGAGTWIDVSGQECISFALEDAVPDWYIARHRRRRLGSRAREAGTGVYPCSDGHVSIVAGRLGTAKAFVALTRWIAEADVPGSEELLEPKWHDFKFRQSVEGVTRFAELFTVFARTRTRQELYREGQARQIAIAPVNTISDLLQDPQLVSRGFFRAPPDGGSERTFPGPPYRLSRTPARVRRPAPRLGQDDADVDADVAAEMSVAAAAAAARASGAGGALRLDGLRVLDFCWIGAGAFVTRLLADMGAEVIKVESRSHPDNLRLSGPHKPGAAPLESSGYFASRNTSKKSIALDMSKPEGRALALRLAERCGVVTNNFRPGIMERWGLGYDAVSAVNPSVIYLSMPMQGATGPHRDYIGFGSTIAALCGLVSMAREPGRPPLGTSTHYPDHIPNPGHALVALLAAVFHRGRSGEGQSIELAQIESTVNVLGPSLLSWSGQGLLPDAAGNRRPGLVPCGVFPCADEDTWCTIEVEDDAQWQALAEALGRPGWMLLPELATVAGRTTREDEIEEHLPGETRRFRASALMLLLQQRGIGASVVNTNADILDDPQLVARDYWCRIPHPEMGEVIVNRPPFHVVGEARPPLGAPPLLGQNTREVARDLLGMDAPEIQRLIDARVFY